MRQVMGPVGYNVPHINCSKPSLKQMCVADKEQKDKWERQAENEDSK
jgi:hypothetical protein